MHNNTNESQQTNLIFLATSFIYNIDNDAVNIRDLRLILELFTLAIRQMMMYAQTSLSSVNVKNISFP